MDLQLAVGWIVVLLLAFWAFRMSWKTARELEQERGYDAEIPHYSVEGLIFTFLLYIFVGMLSMVAGDMTEILLGRREYGDWWLDAILAPLG